MLAPHIPKQGFIHQLKRMNPSFFSNVAIQIKQAFIHQLKKLIGGMTEYREDGRKGHILAWR